MVPHLRATATLIALSAAAFCFVTVEVLPIGLLTTMAGDLGRSHAQIGLLVTGYAGVVVIASFPLTRLTHRMPRRHLFAATLGLFTAATVLTALARTYEVLSAARLITALTQAVFWSIATPAAAGLFPPQVRGRMVARLAIGAALAPLLGIPAGTWLGQQAGWRAAFVAMAVLCLATCVAVTVLMPTLAPQDGGAARGTAPDRRRYWILFIVTVLGVAGSLTAYTYITPFLLEVSGFGPASLGPLLLVSGIAGLVGAVSIGPVLDRRPRAGMVVPLVLMAGALIGLFALGTAKLPAIIMVAVTGLAYSALAPAIGHRTLQVAPGSTDIAAAGISSAFNVGIAAGSLLGGVLITGAGVRSIALAGALLVGAALAITLSETIFAGRSASRREEVATGVQARCSQPA